MMSNKQVILDLPFCDIEIHDKPDHASYSTPKKTHKAKKKAYLSLKTFRPLGSNIIHI